MDSGHIILSAVQPETVAGRVDRDISSSPIIAEIPDEEKERNEANI